MATPAAILQILVTANSAGALKVLNTTDARLSRSASHAERVATKTANAIGKATKYGALGVAALGGVSAKLAVDFDKSMRNVNSIAGLSERRFQRLERSVLRLAGPTAQAPKTLAEGLYDLVSSGFRAGEAIDVLRASARAATAGLTDTAISTKAVAAVLNAYRLPARKAAQVSDDLFQTVNLGVVSFEELAGSIGYVLPAAATMGVGIKQVGAAISTLTKQGQSGDSAVTNLNSALTAFIKPTRDMQAALKKLGFENAETLIRTKGFQGALEAVIGSTDGTRKAVGGLFGDVRAMRAAFGLTGANARAAAADLRGFQHDTGATSRVLAEQSKSISFQWNRLKAQAEVLGIRVDTKLLPVFSRFLKIISNPNLTGDQKLRKLSKAVGELLSRALEAGAQAAAKAGPRIIASLAGGIAIAWSQMSPLSKLFTVAGILTAVGGRKAIISAGTLIGRVLGGGIAAGALGGGGAGAAGGAAAAGGALGAIRGGLLAGAKRVGLVGLGVVLADGVLSEMGREARAKSPEFLEALKAQQGPRDGFFNKAAFAMSKPGEWLGRAVGAGDSMKWFTEAQDNAKALVPIMERLVQGRRRVTGAEVADIAAKVRTLELTRQQRAQWDRILAVLRQASSLRIRANITGFDPTALSKIRNNLAFLKAGWGTSMADILKVSRRNMALIRNTIGTNTADGRKLAAENMRATASAIRQAMERSGHVTKAGMARVRELIRNANLVDPSRRQAEAFGRQWAAGMDRSKEITRKGLREMLAEARKMPGPMRKVALDVWMGQLEAARRNRTITAREFAMLRSRVAAEFTGMRGAARDTAKSIPASIASMVDRATDGLTTLAGNVNKTLTAFGAKVLKFDLKKVDAQKRQTGGLIVPGHGSGDKVPAVLPVGTGIINRNAARALLEPGELAVPPRQVARMGGPQAIHAINRAVPRFQQGGIIGNIPDAMGALPGLDALAMVLSQRFGLAVVSGLRPGAITTTGNLSDHSWGGAIDVSNGVTTPQMDAAYAFLTGTAIAKAIKQILYRTMVGGNHFNHIHIALQHAFANNPAAVLQLLGAGELPRLSLDGPDGALKDIGQGAIDKVRAAGTDKIQAVLASMQTLTGPAGGDAYSAGGNGADLMRQISEQRGWSFPDWWALDGRETGHGADVFNESSKAFGRGQFLPMNYGKYGPGSDPAQHPSMVQQIEAMASYIADRYGSTSAAWAHEQAAGWYQQGGIIRALQTGGIAGAASAPGGGGNVDPVTRQLGRTLRLIRRRAKIPKRHKAMGEAMRLIADIGLPADRQQEIHDLSLRADVANEYAQRAAALSYDLLYAARTPFLNPDGSVVPGKFHEIGDPVLDADNRPMRHAEAINGMVDFEWVRVQLDALFALRNRLIEAEAIVAREQQRTARLLQQARERLALIRRLIKRAEQLRARVERDLRKAERQLEDARHSEEDIPGLKDKVFNAQQALDSALRHPRENAARIPHLREKLAEAQRELQTAQQGRDAIPGLRDQVRGLRERLREINGKLRTDRAMQTAVRAAIGDSNHGLLGKQGSLREFRGNILDQGDDGFKGLQMVQGLAAPMTVLAEMPPIGVLGGEIFTAQQSWADLTKLPAPVVSDPGSSGTDDSERVALLTQLLTESQQRAFVANQQFAVLRSLPFGGVFHTSGIVPGLPSQDVVTVLRGREGVMTPQQMAVTSAAVVAGAASPQTSRVEVVIRDQRTHVFIDDQEVRATVRDETRQIARSGRSSSRAGDLRRG